MFLVWLGWEDWLCGSDHDGKSSESCFSCLDAPTGTGSGNVKYAAVQSETMMNAHDAFLVVEPAHPEAIAMTR